MMKQQKRKIPDNEIHENPKKKINASVRSFHGKMSKDTKIQDVPGWNNTDLFAMK